MSNNESFAELRLVTQFLRDRGLFEDFQTLGNIACISKACHEEVYTATALTSRIIPDNINSYVHRVRKIYHSLKVATEHYSHDDVWLHDWGWVLWFGMEFLKQCAPPSVAPFWDTWIGHKDMVTLESRIRQLFDFDLQADFYIENMELDGNWESSEHFETKDDMYNTALRLIAKWNIHREIQDSSWLTTVPLDWEDNSDDDHGHLTPRQIRLLESMSDDIIYFEIRDIIPTHECNAVQLLMVLYGLSIPSPQEWSNRIRNIVVDDNELRSTMCDCFSDTSTQTNESP